MNAYDPGEFDGQFSVRRKRALDLDPGDVVWAQDDGDWLTVHRVHYAEVIGQVTVYRADDSLAEFEGERNVLVRE